MDVGNDRVVVRVEVDQPGPHRTLYVCAHPRIDNESSSEWAASWDGHSAGVNTASVAMTNATAVEGDVLASVVACLPAADR